MDNKDVAIVATLEALKKKYGKGYCYPSQKKLLTLTKDIYGAQMSRRTLNRRLAKLENKGCVARIRRHTRGPDGQILFRTTAYYIKRAFVKCFFFLQKSYKSLSGLFRVPHVAQYPYYEKGYSEVANTVQWEFDPALVREWVKERY